MRFWLFAIMVGGLAYGVSEGANAHSTGKKSLFPVNLPAQFGPMETYGAAEAPIGHVEFCMKNRDDCLPRGGQRAPVSVGDDELRELRTINREVNRSIRPMSDKEQYGVVERWVYPDTGKGDCEDYVLLKQRKLIKAGWPQSDLLITVVRDENGEGHAVLAVRTNRGDYILDNKTSDVVTWKQTQYAYIKRQSTIDPQRWESLVPSPNGTTVAAAGIESRK
jgi:predicted transglutaminase-like cysteine proteinase